MGSSPHTRDKSKEVRPDICNNRIIPAYAGQMVLLLPIKVWNQDHPRIRGTNLEVNLGETPFSGSSPHTRDKSVLHLQKSVRQGIIPAYAGQIPIAFVTSLLYKDHPRIRGTNRINFWLPVRSLGSSPHTRDKSLAYLLVIGNSGIIPAYAGQINLVNVTGML